MGLGERADGSGPLDVGADLRQEFFQAGELPRGAEAVEEVELDRLAVEVAVEADQVGLDGAVRSPKVAFGPTWQAAGRGGDPSGRNARAA